jgi:hypothetical protein
LVQRQADGGLSIRRFCDEEKISEPSFYGWRRKLERRPRGRPTGTQKLPAGRNADHGQQAGFIPVQLIEVADSLELVHPLGYQIRLAGNVNSNALRQVLDVLDERGGR